LARGEAEIAIQTPRPRQPALVAVRIARTSSALYVSRTLPGAPRRVATTEDLGGRPLLVYSPPFHLLQEAKWFQPLLASGPIALETNSTHALLAAARAGAGIAVLPRFVARPYKDLALVSESVADQEVWLTTHPEFRRDPKVRVTADFLKRAATSLV
jgi:DNA-binding transcriptional LysR family regulator